MFGNSLATLTERFSSEVISTDFSDFEQAAINLFYFHYENNTVYREYCYYLRCNPATVHSLKDIPFLPIAAFKKYRVGINLSGREHCFESSGTTARSTSRHFVSDLNLYEKSFRSAFNHFYGAVEDLAVLALLPSYLERNNSSLVYMVNDLIQNSRQAESGFFLNDLDRLHTVLNQLAAKQQATLLIGVSFGLLDFVEQYSFSGFKELQVMETGGMKGRRKEMIREELHEQLKQGFGVPFIHSEYGMTELLSQAYAAKEGRFFCPPWMQVLIRKQDDPLTYCEVGETGGINVIDLANLASCPFIQTDDLGRRSADGAFEVLGRFDASDVRGCNLMIV